MERHTMFIDAEKVFDIYCKDVNATQSKLQIQCNSYQNINNIFCTMLNTS